MGLTMRQMRHSRCSVPIHSRPASLQNPILTPSPTATTTEPANQQLCCRLVLDSLYRVFAAAAVAVAVTQRLPGHPCPALLCPALPCLENQSPCFPILQQSLSLPLPAAPHRGVFRGADVTVHVTAPSGAAQSMYREQQESQECQAILCSEGGDPGPKVPRYRKGTDTHAAHNSLPYAEWVRRGSQSMYKVHTQHRRRGISQSFEVSLLNHFKLQLAAVVFVFAFSCHPDLPLTQSQATAALSMPGEVPREKESRRRSPVVGGTTIGPPDSAARLPSRHPHQLLSPVNLIAPPPGSFSFSLNSGEPHT